jgi:hypothetical protein
MLDLHLKFEKSNTHVFYHAIVLTTAEVFLCVMGCMRRGAEGRGLPTKRPYYSLEQHSPLAESMVHALSRALC